MISELEAKKNITLADRKKIRREAVRDGRLFKLSDRRYALPAQLWDLSNEVIAQSDANEAISVIALKKRWGLGRNLTVEILEFFDSIRFTQRRGDVRIVLDAELPARRFSQ